MHDASCACASSQDTARALDSLIYYTMPFSCAEHNPSVPRAKVLLVHPFMVCFPPAVPLDCLASG